MLNEPDKEDFSAKQRPGSPCLDAPVTRDGIESWFLNQLGNHFTGLLFADASGSISDDMRALRDQDIPVHTVVVKAAGWAAVDGDIIDQQEHLRAHYDARPGTYYLIRPDQHVAARWRSFDRQSVNQALARATGHLI